MRSIKPTLKLNISYWQGYITLTDTGVNNNFGELLLPTRLIRQIPELQQFPPEVLAQTRLQMSELDHMLSMEEQPGYMISPDYP